MYVYIMSVLEYLFVCLCLEFWKIFLLVIKLFNLQKDV